MNPLTRLLITLSSIAVAVQAFLLWDITGAQQTTPPPAPASTLSQTSEHAALSSHTQHSVLAAADFADAPTPAPDCLAPHQTSQPFALGLMPTTGPDYTAWISVATLAGPALLIATLAIASRKPEAN